jgi:hypothetical protein
MSDAMLPLLPLILNGRTFSRYAVCTVLDCRIVHGEIPCRDLPMLCGGYSPKALADMKLAERLGATLVIGEPEHLAELREFLDA